MPNSHSNFMIYSGIHFKTCPIEYREAWNLISNPEAVHKCITKVTKQNLEFVNIGTCNRFDICIFGKVTKAEIFEIFYLIALDYFKTHNLSEFISNPDKIHDFLHIHIDSDALRHLFQVTASLNSLVLGEQQILGQIKSAFLKCSELNFARKNAHRIFTQTLRVAKKIRHETDIGKNSLSIGNAAIEMIQKVFDTIEDKKILIIGAGDMAKIVAKNFFSAGVKSLYIANRTFEKCEKIAFELGFAIPIDLPTALENLYEYDICVIAVNGNHLIVTNEILKKFRKKRQGNLTVFIDISVPRKITPAAHNIDNLFLFYVDDLDKIMEQNRKLRKKSALEAENIIEAEVHKYNELCIQKENLVHIAKMHRWLQKTINYEVDRYLYNTSKGKQTSPRVIADAVTKRIISHTAQLSKHNKKPEIPSRSVGEMLEFLFNLSEQEELEFTKMTTPSNLIPLKQNKGQS